MRRLSLSLCLFVAVIQVTAGNDRPQFGEKPKLVVGIVVDQMRWDYLSIYYNRFTREGFRRMIDDGYSFDNCLINYLPTVTAIGHTSAYTGTTPAFHGICGNTFFIDGKKTYCCEDSTVKTVGTDNKRVGQMSPKNLLATTIGDQLRIHTNYRSKVIGVSYKDRAAIFPAGHAANAAYWLDLKNGQFVSSTYYMQELPQWVKEVNQRMSQNQELKKLGKEVGLSPLAGTLTADMAIAALKGENLGKGEETDMLCVSFSQTDVIGHKWSTRGEHTDEAYLELDKDLARLFDALDEQVGKGNYIAFLTADHGAAHNSQWMEDNKLHAGKWLSQKLRKDLDKYVTTKLGNSKPVILGILDYRFFLDKESIRQQGLDYQRVKDVIVEYLLQSPNLSFVVDCEKIATTALPPVLRDRMLLGYNYHRGGEIYVVPEPGYYEFGSWSSPVGTTHGEWNPYDAHIPLLFYGWHVPHGSHAQEVHITDIAPTVCSLLHVQQPNASIGDILLFD
ncbi:MAG: alkaline phosphatase family protein [Prevotella sp.]|nr:alkaline phosphatase family protein [Prevotella sp.]